MTDSILWYATRGAGAVSLILLSIVLALGILSALRWRATAWPRFLTVGLHRNLALLSVVFLALHIVTAVVDPYTSLGWAAALVPFSSHYRTLWLGLGVIAVDLFVALVVTTLLRRTLGPRIWRSVHWVAYACWPLVVAHSLGTGTDSTRSWMLVIELLCVAMVLSAFAARLMGSWRSQSRPAPITPRVASPTPAPAWSGVGGTRSDEASRW
jgi:methionine sulfoxide reductase heme-binding subunit